MKQLIDRGVVRQGRWALTIVIVVLATVVARAETTTEPPDLAVQSAVHLLRSSGQLRRDRSHLALLRALCQLDDPGLAPLFKRWADSGQPALQVHGILGLAQSHPDKQLDINRLLAIENPVVAAQLLITAMEAKRLNIEQARRLLSESRIDPGVRLLAGLHLAHKNQPIDVSLLDELTATPPQDSVTLVPMLSIPRSQWSPQELLTLEQQVRQSLTILLKLQQGQPGAIDALQQIVQAIRDPGRDAVTQMLLATAISYELDQTLEWAGRLLEEERIIANKAIYTLALQAGLRYGVAEAVGLWQRDYEAASDLADRLRRAILLLRTAPWVAVDPFHVLLKEEDPLLRAIGQAGTAIATGQEVAPSVLDLTRLNHPAINQWAIAFAKNRAGPQDGFDILTGLITDGRATVQQIVTATGALCELAPDAAVGPLRTVLTSRQTEAGHAQAILLGLIQASPKSRPGLVIESLGPFSDPDTKQLALVLAAKSGQPLTVQQRQDLQLLVRGGGGMQDSLRLQAAWAYLKLTGNTTAALDEAYP